MGLLDRLLGRKEKQPSVTQSRTTQDFPEEKPRKLSYIAANLQMQGERERQEDSFAVLNSMDVTQVIRQGLFVVVADGMGGMRDGKQVSEAAVTGFVELFHALDREQAIPRQLEEGARAINESLCGAFGGAGGTTAVAALFYDSALYWLSVGDSAIFLKRGGGLFRLNKEHTYLNELYMKELACDSPSKATADADPDGARLSGFLGMDGLGEIDFNKRPLKLFPGDAVFLCTDGISGALSEDEISEALDMPPGEGCALMNEWIQRKANPYQDNYTGVIVGCRD